MTIDEILFVLLIAFVGAGDGLLYWIAKHLHTNAEAAGAAPSALHVVALTEKVGEQVEATRVHNALVPAIMARLEHALAKAPAVTRAAPVPTFVPDPHPAGAVATPVIPVVMPSAAQPVAPADMAAMLAHMQAMAEHMKALATPAPVVVQTTITAPTPEPTAQPLTIADPAPTVQPTVAAPAVAA